VLGSAIHITHPFHPRCGQALNVFACRAQWGEERVFYHDVQGHRASLPAHWTSLVAPDPHVAIGAGRSPFRLQDLLELAALLQELRP
jgi:hypothetical protein